MDHEHQHLVGAKPQATANPTELNPPFKDLQVIPMHIQVLESLPLRRMF